MSFCAVCISDVGPFTKEPIGPRDALVSVCRKCASEPVKEPVEAPILLSDAAIRRAREKARMKRWRSQNIANGRCANGPDHATPVSGSIVCPDCRAREQRRSA